MQVYFAPLEGITDSIFRRLHHKHFPGIHRYYTPFFSPTVHRNLTPREARELPPADELDVTVVPQLLTKQPEDFIWMSSVCKDRGYTEVNLNLGCPSGTVTAKGKGAGMLRDLQQLDAFLSEIYKKPPLDISIKARIGFESPDEFPALLDIFNRYPIKELTLHPRVRKEFYSFPVHTDVFAYAVENSQSPLCYNGELKSQADIAAVKSHFPQLQAVMLGRGLIADPGMLTPGGSTPQKLEAFYDELLEEYLEAFGGSRNAMFRMKEHWGMLIGQFENSEKLGKAIRKTTDLAQYKSLTHQIFTTLPFRRG